MNITSQPQPVSASAISTALPDKRLHGIVPPMITPLLNRDALDVAGLERLIEHILQGGVHALFILGTTGEGPNLSYRLRREVIDRVCRQVRNRVPVLVGITDTSFIEAVNLAGYAADVGAQAVVSAAPYYFPSGQPELLDYFTRLAPELPLPLFLYNMPQMTKVQFSPEILQRLLEVPRIIGVKDSSGDFTYFQRVLQIAKQRPDWSVLMGPEHLTAAAIQIGAQGGVNGGANVWPQLFVQIYNAASVGDQPALAKLTPQLEAFGAIYCVGQHPSAVIKGIKCALSLLGICDDHMSEPFSCFRAPEREKVRAVLQQLGLLH
jgi:4-hydroxy-tetrahydrodipicolinate synthase